MLVVNVIFLIFTVYSAASTTASINAATPSTKFKRVIVDSDSRDIYNNQEQYGGGIQSTPKIALSHDINSRSSSHYRNAKATDGRKVSYPNHGSGSHAYGSVPKRPFPYASSTIHQTESRQNSPLAPYFNILNNPVTYKAATSGGKPLDASKAIVSLQKLQGTYSPTYNALHRDKSIELSDFSDSDYPSYASVSKIIAQSFRNDVSPAAQVPVYKTSYPLPKITEYTHVYAPSFPTVSSAAALFDSSPSDKTKYNFKQGDETTVEVNGKKIAVPIVQLPSNQDLSSVFPAFESQPFLLSASYPIESGLGFTYGDGPKFNMALQSKNASPFLSPLSSFQGQIVPIQTASSTPQFPQYKGASVEVYPVSSNAPKTRGSYESFYSQPQLHFGKPYGSQSANAQQSGLRPSAEDILEDAEVIDKKNPEPHPSQTDDDDDEEDERNYTSREIEYEHSYEDHDDDRESGKHFKDPPMESNFKPSTFFPFKEYDEKFGKHTTHINDEDKFEDKPHSSYKNQPLSDVDDEEEEDTSEYHENTESSKPSHAAYEEEEDEEEEKEKEQEEEEEVVEEEKEKEEEEESRKDERHEETDEDSYEVEPKQSKYHGKDFEQNFEESYKKQLPKNRYVHVKDVPEVDSYDNLKSFRNEQRSKNDSKFRINPKQSAKSKSQQPRLSRKNRKTLKRGYKDSAAYGSDVFSKKTPKVIHEEFFGYKNPRTGKYPKRAKLETEKYSFTEKPSKEDNNFRTAKYYKFKNFKTGDGLASKNKYPSSYSSADNWKSDKSSLVETETLESSVQQLSDPDDTISSYAQSAVSGVRSLTNAEILRDLTGI